MSRRTSSLSLGRESLVGLIAKFALGATGFIGIIVFFRVLGTETLGVYFTLLAAAKVASQLPNGFSIAVKKRVSEEGTDSAEYLGLGLLGFVVFTAVAAIGGSVLFPLFSDAFTTRTHLIGALVLLASLALFGLAQNFYAGIGYPGASVWSDAARSVATLGLQLLFVVFGFREFGLVGGLALATLATALALFVVTGIRPRLPSRTAVDRTVAFARWSAPNSMSQNLYNRVDVLILAAIVGNTAVGLYEPAQRLTVPATFVAASIGGSLTVKASGLSSLEQSVEMDLKNAVSYTGLLSIPLFFGALAMPVELMRTIYGPAAVAGSTALVGLALFQVFNTLALPFDKVIQGIGRPDIQFGVAAATLLVNVPLAVFLGERYGLDGVVAATVVAESLRLVGYQFVGYWQFDSVIITRPVLEQVASGLVMFVVVSVLTSTVIQITNWVWLLLAVAVGGLTYFGTLLAVSPHFRLTLRNVSGDLVSE